MLLTSVPPEILPAYPVILLAGDIDFDLFFLSELEKALRRGSRVLMSERHREALGREFQRVADQGAVEVLEPWLNPATGRPAAIANERLRALTRDLLPVTVEGDPIQYAVNRTPHGWVIELINNRSILKRGDQPMVVDPKGTVRVTLKAKRPFAQVAAWRSDQEFARHKLVSLELGPGAVEYIEFREAHP